MPTHPEVLWAQRSSTSDSKKNVIYLTVNLPDIIESTLKADLTATGLKFQAKAGNESKGLQEKDYEFSIEFYEEIDPAESSQRLNSRAFDLVLSKKELKSEYWPRLYKGAKLQFVKTNFSKWVDEDEQDEIKPSANDDDDFNPMGGMGGMGGMPGMGGMGGMPGMGGMGGMPGMGGMGMPGMGGMGMPGMGGMGGAGDAMDMDMGNVDFDKMLADLRESRAKEQAAQGAGADAADDDGDDSDDEDDEGPPPLEDAPKAS